RDAGAEVVGVRIAVVAGGREPAEITDAVAHDARALEARIGTGRAVAQLARTDLAGRGGGGPADVRRPVERHAGRAGREALRVEGLGSDGVEEGEAVASSTVSAEPGAGGGLDVLARAEPGGVGDGARDAHARALLGIGRGHAA